MAFLLLPVERFHLQKIDGVLTLSFDQSSTEQELWLWIGGLTIAAAAIALFIWLWHARKAPPLKKPVRNPRLIPEPDAELGSSNFVEMDIPLKEIRQATGNFNENFLIGQGAYGVVYKGRGLDGQHWAVLRSSAPVSPAPPHFIREVCALFRLSHHNIVRLLGYCEEGSEQIIVYEYVANGNLKQHLRPRNPDRAILTFSQRVDIAAASAQGLYFLHKFTSPPLAHRDISSESILLDKNFQPKIGDFGLFKLVHPHCEPSLGSIAYVDPEYWSTGKLTPKSDVYSFGTVLLELITGQEPVITVTVQSESQEETSFKSIVSWVSHLYESDNIAEIVDERLEGVFSYAALRAMVAIALECLKPVADQRPEMSQVTNRLMDVQEIVAAEARAEPSPEPLPGPSSS